MIADGTIAFVGSGIMAEAMIKGLRKEGLLLPAQIMPAGCVAAHQRLWVLGSRVERGEQSEC
jgi:pyrroline-5-carboxylate reductase